VRATLSDVVCLAWLPFSCARSSLKDVLQRIALEAQRAFLVPHLRDLEPCGIQVPVPTMGGVLCNAASFYCRLGDDVFWKYICSRFPGLPELLSPDGKLHVCAIQDTWDLPADLWLVWQHGACCVAKDDGKHTCWSLTVCISGFISTGGFQWCSCAASPNNDIGWSFDHPVADLSFDLLTLMPLCALTILRIIFPPRWSNTKNCFCSFELIRI